MFTDWFKNLGICNQIKQAHVHHTNRFNFLNTDHDAFQM